MTHIVHVTSHLPNVDNDDTVKFLFWWQFVYQWT